MLIATTHGGRNPYGLILAFWLAGDTVKHPAQKYGEKRTVRKIDGERLGTEPAQGMVGEKSIDTGRDKIMRSTPTAV
jgi:hypothetical protein